MYQVHGGDLGDMSPPKVNEGSKLTVVHVVVVVVAVVVVVVVVCCLLSLLFVVNHFP